MYEWERKPLPYDLWGNPHYPEQRLEKRFSLYDTLEDAAAFHAVQVAHKLCEQQAAESVWLNKYPRGLPCQEERELDLRSAIAHAQTALAQRGEAYLIEANVLLKRGADGRYDRTYGV